MRSFTILLAIAIISLSNGATIFQEIQWNDFKLKFQKSFRSFSDETIRKQNFLKNLKTIELHNAKYEQGLSTYYMGVNFYSDWTWEEFEKTLLNENVEVLSYYFGTIRGICQKATLFHKPRYLVK